MADAADEVTMRWFRTKDLPVESKPDDTPVSIADRESEKALRSIIESERPDHGVVGEEFGTTDSGAGARWILDPIDGTKNYIRGVPVFATLIALEVEGVLELGVTSAPALGRRWWGVRDEGAWCNHEPIHVSAVNAIEDAFMSSDSYDTFDRLNPARSDAWTALTKQVNRTRGFGDFWSHMLVAEGAIDIAIEPEVAIWDVASNAVIVEAAGGRVTTLEGKGGANNGSVLATNGVLHDAVLAAMKP
ncbi:MAG: histidinol-phosphatase [Actinomycetota bacterium]